MGGIFKIFFNNADPPVKSQCPVRRNWYPEVGAKVNAFSISSISSRVDHIRKIRDRKQRTDIGKYSFVNRTIKNWNQLPAEALGIFLCKPKRFRNIVKKAIIYGVR